MLAMDDAVKIGSLVERLEAEYTRDICSGIQYISIGDVEVIAF